MEFLFRVENEFGVSGRHQKAVLFVFLKAFGPIITWLVGFRNFCIVIKKLKSGEVSESELCAQVICFLVRLDLQSI